jgi:hypothetical protein
MIGDKPLTGAERMARHRQKTRKHRTIRVALTPEERRCLRNSMMLCDRAETWPELFEKLKD